MLVFMINQIQHSIFGEKYQRFLQTDQITFFKLMMITLCVDGLISLLVVIIQEQSTELIAIIAASTTINFLLIFQAHRIKLCIQYVLVGLYMFFVASGIIVMLKYSEGPTFLIGYGCGSLFCAIIQFCNPKVKLLLVLVTPWIFFAFANVFVLNYLNYIAFVLSATLLLGFFTFQFEAKQQLIHSQSIIMKNQQEIIKQFTSDNLFAISYNDRENQFKLEFANASFENLYQEDIKQTLRIFQVIQDQETNQKKNDRLETLEEYLFQYNKEQKYSGENSQFNVKIKHLESEKLQDITILRTHFRQPIFVISMKLISGESQNKKQENKLSKLKEIIISISSEIGLNMQSQYQNLNELMRTESQNKSEICLIQHSNILRILNRMKNYLIYFQSHKLQILQASIKNYQLQVFQQALLNYFEIQSKLKNRYFMNTSSINLNDNYLLRNSQSLLTQILLNTFNTILAISEINSTIRFTVANENSNLRDSKQIQRSQTSQKLLNSQELSQIAMLQFKFTLTSDHEIKNLERLFCMIKHDQNVETEENIICSVNYLILRTIGPFNEIYTRTYQTSDFVKYFHEVSFYVYIDQTQLDVSYIKQNEIKRDL